MDFKDLLARRGGGQSLKLSHNAGFGYDVPSPEFLSSSQLTKKFNPLTKREGIFVI